MTLFIIKKFYDYDGSKQVSNGLKSSARFVVDMLLSEGFRAAIAEADDMNCIDRIVTQYRPKKVVIEALWVTPAKFAELKKLHPSIEWTVRIHSEIPFLANEGIAIEWIVEYFAQDVAIAFNSGETAQDFQLLGVPVYLPNYYPQRKPRPIKFVTNTLNVGCFGAIRPMKNQLIQAFAAISFAEQQGCRLVFHMNGSRVEQQGSNALRQIAALFKATHHGLVIHPWLDHDDFLELVGSMDICLQASLTESFNIVSADAVSMGVPLVGSDAISWLPKRSKAKADSMQSIVAAMGRADQSMVHMNQDALERFLEDSKDVWTVWMETK